MAVASPRMRFAALAGPALIWLAIFLLIPCVLILVNSFFTRGLYGGIDYIPIFEDGTWAIAENFQLAASSANISIFLNSAKIAGLTTLVALLIGYPAAYAIAQASPRNQPLLLFLAILPFWSNYLIRTYAWIVMLNSEGLANQVMAAGGYEGEPISLLYTEATVIIGLVYNYMPFVILTIYSSISRLNPELWEASRDLGASPARTFFRVILPLTVPGIAAGAVFVFVLSIGNYVTPALLGGGKVPMIGTVVYNQFFQAQDWPVGSALSLMLIAVMMILLMMQAFITRRSQGARA